MCGWPWEGHTTLDVVWDAPHSDGGDPDLSYVVRRRAGATGNWSSSNVEVTVSETGIGNRAVLSELVNGVTYQVEVAASNSAGNGTPVVVEGEPMANRPPGDPTILSIRAGLNQLTVSWRAPSDQSDFAAVTYEVRYRESGGGWTTFAAE